MFAALVTAVALHSGLYGSVRIDPAFPVCPLAAPCSRPAAGVHLTFSRGGRVVGRTTTRANGSYGVALPRGRYTAAVAPAPRIGRGLSPRTVTVTRGTRRRIDFTLDVGIR